MLQTIQGYNLTLETKDIQNVNRIRGQNCRTYGLFFHEHGKYDASVSEPGLLECEI